MRDAEIDRLSNILTEKDAEMQEIEDQMRGAGGAAAAAVAGIYSAMKGDAVDEYLAKYINLMQC